MTTPTMQQHHSFIWDSLRLLQGLRQANGNVGSIVLIACIILGHHLGSLRRRRGRTVPVHYVDCGPRACGVVWCGVWRPPRLVCTYFAAPWTDCGPDRRISE